MRTSTGQSIKLKDYREPDYWIKTVDLTVRLDPEATKISCTMEIERHEDVATGTELVLDGDELQLLGIQINGQPLSDNGYSATPEQLTISELPGSESFELTLETVVAPQANTKLMGLFRSNGVYCTQCEAEGFRRITYFLDRPDVLAVYTTRVEADKAEAPLLLANGNCIEKGDLENGRHFAVWHDPHPKPSYLFALVGGDLDAWSDSFTTMNGREVELNVYVEKGKAPSAAYAMDALKRSMKWDEERFGREYDLDIFNIVAVSDFNMGAMENKGLNVFNDKYVLADADSATDTDFANVEGIIAHEYFHNWTGNRITCRDWFQLCLKEGLTVYRDQEFSSDQRSRPVVRIAEVRILKSSQFPEDAGPLAHPVRPEEYKEINNFYTATVYQKGAELVRMIATLLGEEDFRKGMDIYFNRHDGDAATVEDFLNAFQDASDKDLNPFGRWYAQAGTPQVTVSSKYQRSNNTLTLEFEQSVAATPGQSTKIPVPIPVRFGLVGENGEDLKWQSVEGGIVNGDIIELTERSTQLVFSGVKQRPVPSLLRGFSAPVNLDYRLSEEDLVFLASRDSDPFNRWQALQSFATRLICGAIKTGKTDKSWIDQRYLDAVNALVSDTSLEPAYRATVATPPSENDISRELKSNIDPDVIYSTRYSLIEALAKQICDHLPDDVPLLPDGSAYSPDAASAGKRALSLVLLGYRVIADGDQGAEIIGAYYDAANNLTDRLGALGAALNYQSDRDETLALSERFYAEHKSNPLIIDKWFITQAAVPGAGTLERVIELTAHEAFSMNNPNRVRSLIGSFAMGNATAFNRDDGKGYTFMADKILELDAINPQVAARILTAFRSWRSNEPKRQALAKAALERIASHTPLSRDVSDIVERSLA